jgi:peptide/nickel transport system substrate-binding protein
MNRRSWLSAAAVAVLALAAAACQSTATSTAPSGVGKHPLVEESNTGVTFTRDFNPFDKNSTAQKMNMDTLVYEPLYEIDALNSQQQHPWLASGYSWQNGGKDIAITLKSGVKFSDGSSMTANDVAATFKAIKDVPAANYSGLPTQAADPTASGSTVTLHFATPQFTNFFAILGSTFIVPASLVTRLGTNLATATLATPVGTGPFMVDSFSPSIVKFKPNPHYWGGTPPEPEIDVPALATNNAASQALAAGQLDWAGNDIANVYQNYVNLNPVTNHAWFASGNTVTLWFNVAYGALGDPQVRKAISYGINRTELASYGESGYEYPATSSSALILPNQKSYLPSDGSLVNDLPASNEADATKAKADNWTGPTVSSILTADGYSGWTPNGGNCTGAGTNCWTKNGQIISFNIEDPIPYSDYWTNAGLISQELQGEGINATTLGDAPDTGWYTNYQSGNFQAMLHWGAGGPIPFVQYQNWLDSTQPKAAGNYGGFQSAQAQQALQTLEGTNPSDTSAVNAATQALEQIMSTQVPQAPLLYGADWNVYSTSHYTGWPDASNPYMDPSPNDPELPYILMKLKPAS